MLQRRRVQLRVTSGPARAILPADKFTFSVRYLLYHSNSLDKIQPLLYLSEKSHSEDISNLVQPFFKLGQVNKGQKAPRGLKVPK